MIAHFTQRNEPIFQKDYDFEVFVNSSGSNHDYKELELNAINTVWTNLIIMLDKPYYDDNGHEHSASRIAKPSALARRSITKFMLKELLPKLSREEFVGNST